MSMVGFLERIDKQIDIAIEEQNKLIADLDIGPLVEKNLESIKRYAIKEFAQILYDCVECQENRQDIDWFTAERFLNEKFTDEMWIRLAQQDIILRTYDSLAKKYNQEGQILYPEISFNIINHLDGYFHDLGEIIKILIRMKEYPENGMDKRLLDASNSDEKRSYYLRRLIWDWGYRDIKAVLPMPPYIKVKFG